MDTMCPLDMSNGHVDGHNGHVQWTQWTSIGHIHNFRFLSFVSILVNGHNGHNGHKIDVQWTCPMDTMDVHCVHFNGHNGHNHKTSSCGNVHFRGIVHWAQWTQWTQWTHWTQWTPNGRPLGVHCEPTCTFTISLFPVPCPLFNISLILISQFPSGAQLLEVIELGTW